jgi:hypothetical protein
MKSNKQATLNLFDLRKVFIFIILASTMITAAWGNTETFAGRWTGTFQTPGPSGLLEINLIKNENDWSGAVKIEGPGGKILNKQAQNINVEGEKLIFMIELAGAEITFTGSLKDEKLTGELVGAEDGKTVARGSWQLSRPAKQSSE